MEDEKTMPAQALRFCKHLLCRFYTVGVFQRYTATSFIERMADMIEDMMLNILMKMIDNMPKIFFYGREEQIRDKLSASLPKTAVSHQVCSFQKLENCGFKNWSDSNQYRSTQLLSHLYTKKSDLIPIPHARFSRPLTLVLLLTWMPVHEFVNISNVLYYWLQ